MFEIKLYHYHTDKIQPLLDIMGRQKLTNKDTISNVHTDYGQAEYTPQIVDILRQELEQFGNDVGLQQPYVSDAWFQRYDNDSFHSPHNHGPVGYSSVLYLKYDPSVHGATRFIAPYLDVNGNTLEHSPDVRQGSIIFFPSMLNHYVLPSKSDVTRIIMSMNIKEKA